MSERVRGRVSWRGTAFVALLVSGAVLATACSDGRVDVRADVSTDVSTDTSASVRSDHGATSDVHTTATTPNDGVRVVVARGSNVRVAADSLKRAGVIRSARLFRWYASFSGRDRQIKPGTYLFRTGESYSSIIDDLVSGRAIVHTLTVPEGLDLRDIVPLVSRVLEVPEDSVQAALADSALIAAFNIPSGSIEGYLFPDTYILPSGTTAREAVQVMTNRFREVWKSEWDERARAMGITRHQALTMASIVEKEARVADERPVIAAVYWNRLRQNMRLQADPTVQYALPSHVNRVMYRDLKVESRYNTYQNDGLPPGPIASPGAASIEAALNPADVSYLFFVARIDGRHEFRNTYAEHQRAVAQARRAAVAGKPAQ